MLCAPGRNATGKSSFYELPSSLKSHIYPSVCQELKRKIEQRKPPKKATHKVLKRRGGIENVPSESHVSNINQSYEISGQLNKGTTDPLKKLIESKHELAQQKTRSSKEFEQTNPFSYDIILFNRIL